MATAVATGIELVVLAMGTPVATANGCGDAAATTGTW